MSRVAGVYVCPRGAYAFDGRLDGSGLRIDNAFASPGELHTDADVQRQIAKCLVAAGVRKMLVSVTVRGFGVAHHVLSLPPAPARLLPPVIEREMRRLEPDIDQAVYAWTALAAEHETDAVLPRQWSVAAAPTTLAAAIERGVRESGNVLEHFTAVPAAMQRLAEEFFDARDVFAIVAPLPDSLFIGFAIGGTLRLVVEPPTPPGETDEAADVAGMAEELELGAMFLRQQFRGAQVSRVSIVAGAGRYPEAEAAIKARLNLPVERIPLDRLDAPQAVALGGVLDARSDTPLALAGRARNRSAERGGRQLRTAANVAVLLAAVIAAWSVSQALRARDTGQQVGIARQRIEQESFGMVSARETAEQRKLIQDARSAIREVDADRVELQRALTRIASTINPTIRLDSLVLDRATDGWAAKVGGRADGSTNARAIQSLSEFYGTLPERLEVSDLTLERLAYADSADGSATIRFSLSFGIRTVLGSSR